MAYAATSSDNGGEESRIVLLPAVGTNQKCAQNEKMNTTNCVYFLQRAAMLALQALY